MTDKPSAGAMKAAAIIRESWVAAIHKKFDYPADDRVAATIDRHCPSDTELRELLAWAVGMIEDNEGFSEDDVTQYQRAKQLTRGYERQG